MGRPKTEPPSDQASSIVHFSHPHQLHLSNPQTLPQNFSCSGCKLNDAIGPIYTCNPCNFTLHLKCYQLPQQLQHPFDQSHPLTLLPRPVYPEGLFRCDACGNQGGGFSYHCGPCGIDLHTTCATLPTQFAHKCHRHHLRLHYAAPYPGNAFSCDVCNRAGSRTWIYSCCEGCEFDAHLTCVAKLVPGPAHIQQPQQVRPVNYQPQHTNFMNPPNNGAYCAPPRQQPVVMGQPQGQFTANPGYPYNNNMNKPVYGVGAGSFNGGGLANQVVVATAEGIASGVAQATTEAVIQGIFGGGGGGGGGSGVGLADVLGIGDGGSCYDGSYSCGDGTY
ncbi:hypothetical protein CASFOL_033834 [Castilleja foliolosa]|uniref:DC1 domain-containing protein n=1 Tax=Castilleja foliolosa TaxID=1961234 RepID=A0ABD3BY30_9LAMI